jgi:formylglycine-generating enzyme required for sulfatase activity
LNRNDRSFEELDPDTRILIHDAIQQKLEKSTSVQERAAAFRALGWIGDTRPGVGLTPDGIPDILWSKPIPASDFIMGGDPDALKSWDGLVQSIEHEYFVSRYLVTVAQYHAFIKDGGYTERWWQCWTHDGWEWKQRMKKVCPYAWNNPRWAVPNHPVIGVTWYEAFAFSRWLDAKLRSISTMPDSHLEIRLPTEAEWEKCARGPEGRLYPWGNEFQPELANVRETSGVNRTSAVGLFGERAASIYGIEDLAGNVWEWCLSQWREQYQPEDFISLTGDKPRSSRGGSWFHGSKHARAASRFWYRPGVADFCWGFRVCASGPVKFATT